MIGCAVMSNEMKLLPCCRLDVRCIINNSQFNRGTKIDDIRVFSLCKIWGKNIVFSNPLQTSTVQLCSCITWASIVGVPSISIWQWLWS